MKGVDLNRVTKIRVSKIAGTTIDMLRKACIDPKLIHDHFNQDFKSLSHSVMLSNHYYVSKISEKIDIQINSIVQSHRTILVSVEWCGYNISYREISQKRCQIQIPMTLPASLMSSVTGRKLNHLIGGLGPFGELEIIGAQNHSDECVVDLKQTWHPIN